MTRFSDLPLDEPFQRAIADAGYETPTPIQAQAIPHLLQGRDLLGCARTGTGKTAAFALPILQQLSREGARTGIRALVLVPTRELAAQVAESFRTYGAHVRLSVAVVYGGVSQSAQVRSLQRGVDILVATPGRLVDLINQGHARLGGVEVLVLDEADHMLDLGFIPDVRRIIAKVPAKRQTLLFSATMPDAIAKLADGLLHDPVKVMVTPPATTVELVRQSVHHVSGLDKPDLLASILSQPGVDSALVFTRTKRGADRVSKRLAASGIPSLAIHGNKAQNVRERTLRSFKDGTARVLVATDVAARGIDVDGISHVINYDLPHVPETYVHRIGRTGRAGAEGIAIALCSDDEKPLLRDIEKLIKKPVPVAAPVPFTRSPAPPPEARGRRQSEPSRRPAQASRRQAPAARRRAEPTRRHAEPTPRHAAPAPRHAPPAPRHAPPASRHAPPAPRHAEPTHRHAEPARRHAEPTPRHAEAPVASKRPTESPGPVSAVERMKRRAVRGPLRDEARLPARIEDRGRSGRAHGGDRPMGGSRDSSRRPQQHARPSSDSRGQQDSRGPQPRRGSPQPEGRRAPDSHRRAAEPQRPQAPRPQAPRGEKRPPTPARPFRPVSNARLTDDAAPLRRAARRRDDDVNGDT